MICSMKVRDKNNPIDPNLIFQEFMARISYQNSTFRSFYKFDIRLLNWTFALFASAFVLLASTFVFQGGHSFYINNIRFLRSTLFLHKTAFVCQVLSSTFVLHNLFFKFFVQHSFWRHSFCFYTVHCGT